MSGTSRLSLVTGAAGFIGSHLVEALVRRGDRVRAFVRYNSSGSIGHLELLPGDVRRDVEIVAGDLKDPDAVARLIRGCETVFHLAALIGIPYSYVHPMDYVQTNVTGTANLLTAALRSETLRRVVHTSTSEVYGTPAYVPIDEAHPLRPQSPYAASKAAADLYALSLHLSLDLPVVVVRPFNAYGPRQSMRAVVPTIIAQALAGGPVRLGSLEPRRDWTFVDDTVRGFVRAGEAPGVEGETIHLGSGRDVSVGEVATLILDLMKKTTTGIVADEERVRPERSEVDRLQASFEKATRLLGWTPAIALGDGLQRTIDWMAAHTAGTQPELYRI